MAGDETILTGKGDTGGQGEGAPTDPPAGGAAGGEGQEGVAPPDSDETGAEGGTEGEGTPEPTEYGDFTMPEGYEIQPEMLEEFLPIAREAGLKQEQAQQLVDLGSKLVERVQTQQRDAFESQRAEWRKAVETDAQLKGSLETASKGVGRMAEKVEGLRELLNDTGLGDHPVMVRLFASIGEGVSEDKFETAGRGGGEKRDPAQVLYGGSDSA